MNKQIALSKACNILKTMLNNGDFDDLNPNSKVYQEKCDWLINWFKDRLNDETESTFN